MRRLGGWIGGLALGVLSAVPVHADTDLLEVYRLAVANDAQLRAAEAANRAAQQARPQARALLLPSVSGSADISGNRADSRPGVPSDGSYGSWGLVLSLSQPIYRLDRQIQLKQADSRIAQADAELEAARQELILRAATRYFDVLGALDDLEFAVATKEATGQQLRQAQQRFEVGLIAITDVEEAKAASDLAVAQEIAALNQVENAYEALRELISEYRQDLVPMARSAPLVTPEPADIEQWTTRALEQNLSLIAARHGLDTAREEIKRRHAGHYPAIDLVASQDYRDNSGGPSGNRSRDSTAIGLQLSIPLYTGGLINAQTEEARELYQQATDNVESGRRSVQRQTREAYLGVLAGISRVKALQQALTSTQTALEATQAGFEVGTRTTIDVLQSQRATFQSQRDYKLAEYEYILSGLTLKLGAGTLSVADLETVNQWLGR